MAGPGTGTGSHLAMARGATIGIFGGAPVGGSDGALFDPVAAVGGGSAGRSLFTGVGPVAQLEGKT